MGLVASIGPPTDGGHGRRVRPQRAGWGGTTIAAERRAAGQGLSFRATSETVCVLVRDSLPIGPWRLMPQVAPRARTSATPGNEVGAACFPLGPGLPLSRRGNGARGGAVSAAGRGAVRGAAGIGPLRCDGEGLGVTRVSSGVVGDVLTGTGEVRRCPGPHPKRPSGRTPPAGCRDRAPSVPLLSRIDYKFATVKRSQPIHDEPCWIGRCQRRSIATADRPRPAQAPRYVDEAG